MFLNLTLFTACPVLLVYCLRIANVPGAFQKGPDASQEMWRFFKQSRPLPQSPQNGAEKNRQLLAF
jgi:hypothetical protein